MASHAFIVTKQTHRGVIEARNGKDLSASAWPVRLLRFALDYFARHRDRLDLEGTADSVKRDLGFMDGRAPYREEDCMR
ncbi:hypothetical protein [Rhizobium leucaenae]|uniref:Uncharacterized protein n=1 Tax=Rhizobium leucaenae TaxID=29450 RepID=A0A7W6ZYS8_9HYPH|nr:hypothetical protein [Rhizobium leucaenae]MBB4571239.1 hypothetical protein [Rhizobium leucaenae]MBB6304862.1 hypothetical protein [Rhizobium leucaenae]